ncbi:MAG: hypothetical protein LBP75_03050 [Planctomycetota bacterium]|jgi:hypothetical protein|nr:hypothetical protein [Planctomycetota bacterium]
MPIREAVRLSSDVVPATPAIGNHLPGNSRSPFARAGCLNLNIPPQELVRLIREGRAEN